MQTAMTTIAFSDTTCCSLTIFRVLTHGLELGPLARDVCRSEVLKLLHFALVLVSEALHVFITVCSKSQTCDLWLVAPPRVSGPQLPPCPKPSCIQGDHQHLPAPHFDLFAWFYSFLSHKRERDRCFEPVTAACLGMYLVAEILAAFHSILPKQFSSPQRLPSLVGDTFVNLLNSCVMIRMMWIFHCFTHPIFF